MNADIYKLLRGKNIRQHRISIRSFLVQIKRASVKTVIPNILRTLGINYYRSIDRNNQNRIKQFANTLWDWRNLFSETQFFDQSTVPFQVMLLKIRQ